MAMDAGGLARRAAESLGLSSFTTLGISMGGMIAQVVAARCPGVDGLVLVSTTAGGSGRVWPDHVEAPERLSFREWPTDEAGMRRKMSRYFGRRFLEKSPLLVEMMVKNMLKIHSREPGTEEPAEGVPSLASVGSRLQFHASAGFDGTSLLTDLHMPVLVVTGDEDVIIPKENAYFLHSRVAGSRLVEYAGAGHLLLVEEPDAFVNDVAGFLG
jgi:pimeloyl-ACP methyl ester carboxylesterase